VRTVSTAAEAALSAASCASMAARSCSALGAAHVAPPAFFGIGPRRGFA